MNDLLRSALTKAYAALDEAILADAEELYFEDNASLGEAVAYAHSELAKWLEV